MERTVSPSYAPDVIGATLALVEKRAPRGVYHCGSRDWSTWDEVAAFILERLGRAELLDRVEFVPERYPAPRPRHCALSSAKLAPYYATRPWRDAVAEYLDRRVG